MSQKKTIQLSEKTLAKLPEGTLPGTFTLVPLNAMYGIDVGDVIVKLPEFTKSAFEGMSTTDVEISEDGVPTLVPLTTMEADDSSRTPSVPSWQSKAC